MANECISQVQLPNNETYDIKDKNAITEIQIVGETQTKTNGVVNLPAYPSDTKNTAGSTDTSNKIFLIGAKSQAANPQTYSDNQVYVTNGSLFLTKTQDASGTADNKPALLIGNPTSAHLELDTNEVMAKDSATTTGPLYLNNDGGLVYVNNKKVVRLTSDPTSGQVMIADGTDGQIKSSGCTIESSVPSDAVFTDKKVKTVNGVSGTNRYIVFKANSGTDTSTCYTNTGFSYRSVAGTTSTDGYSQLVLGNSTNSGTEDNQYGIIRFYPKTGAGGSSYANLIQTSMTNNSSITHILPATGGTILNTGNYDKYALPLTGGTVTGAINFKSSNLDRNNPPSSETASDAYCNFQDKDGNYIGRVISAMNENGDIELILRARARNAADTGYVINDFKIIKSRNGTNSYYISSPTNFREAIEVYSKLETETSIRSYLISTVGHSCKNLLPLMCESKTYTDGGANLTVTVDKAAGTVTIDGTSRTDDNPITIIVYDDLTSSKFTGKLYYSGGSANCPIRAYDSTNRRWAKAWNGTSSSPYSYSENESSEVLPISGHETQYLIRISPNKTINNEIVRPMLRSGDMLDDTFEPYQVPTDEKKLDKPVELDITTEWTIAEWMDLLNKYNYLQIITYTDVSFDVVIVPLSIFSNITQEVRTVSYASHVNNSSVAFVLFISNGQKMTMGLGTNVNIYKIIGIPK